MGLVASDGGLRDMLVQATTHGQYRRQMLMVLTFKADIFDISHPFDFVVGRPLSRSHDIIDFFTYLGPNIGISGEYPPNIRQ